MKVIIDNKIPFIQNVIERIADKVVYAPGKDFTPALIKEADALIVRTRTQCNRELLEGSQVKFIATATIGFDHIDTEYCQQAGITWSNAPGCNAASVAQYVQSCLFLLQEQWNKPFSQLTIGVVGVGNVGSKIAELGKRLGMKVLLNDPPRAAREGAAYFHSLQTLAETCDILTFHVPLNRSGKYNTYHLADADFFQSLRRKPAIINTSRGEVIETQALLNALDSGQISQAVIDVWENEPVLSLELLNKVFIGTPHIAGYSADGKANATRMALNCLCDFFQLKKSYQILPPQPKDTVIQTDCPAEAALKMYDPRTDCQRLREHPENFELLRGDYPLRRESAAYILSSGLPYPLF